MNTKQHRQTFFRVCVVGDLDVVTGIVPDFLGNAPRPEDAHVLEARHGGAEATVLDVEAKVSDALFGVGDGTVDVQFSM